MSNERPAVRPTVEKPPRPTEEEAWDRFWAIIAQMTVDLHERGEY